MHGISRQDGDWASLSTQVLDWLNTHVAPHLLVSVSFHEDSHPNNSGKIHAKIAHRSGDGVRPLAEMGATSQRGKLYSVQMARHEQTNESVRQAVAQINQRGGQEGHVVSTTNDSRNQDIVCISYSWAAIVEHQLEEELRPTGCACTIF